MHEVAIYGASDDLIEVEGDAPGCDEYNAEEATFVVTGANGSATRVEVKYGAGGCWMIGVAPIDEDVAMVTMAMRQQAREHPDAPGYSARAVFADVQRVDRIAV